MNNKLPEEYLYEYVVMCNGDELAVYYSDAIPPEVGTLIDPWEFAIAGDKRKENSRYQGPYKVIEISQQPKNMEGNGTEVSTQTLVHIVVESGSA